MVRRGATLLPRVPSASRQASPETRMVVVHGCVMGVLSGLATATQLRSAGSAGIFDIAIIAYAVVLLVKRRPSIRSADTYPGLFLIGFVALGSLGGLLGVVTSDKSVMSVFLGLLPYLFALLGVEFALSHKQPTLYLNWWMATHGLVVIGTQLVLLGAFYIGKDSVGPIELFIGDRERKIRFLGWTNNSNQLAMAVTIAIAAIGISSLPQILKWVGASGGMLLGIMTLSDGFRVACIASAATLAAVVIFSDVDVPRHLRSAVKAGAVVLGIVVALNIGSLISSAATTANEADQAGERVELWTSCLDTVEVSPLVGLGPGKYGSLDGQDRSCHNTFVEGATFAGLPVIVYLLWTMVKMFQLQIRRGQFFGIWFLVQGSVQMVFSFFFRYPQLWMIFLALHVGTKVYAQRPSVGDQSETVSA